MAADHRLETRALSAQRGHARLFAGVDFSLAGGEALVVQGPNGSGKTTLLRIVAGLTMPTAGEVCWENAPMRAFDPRLRHVVAFNGHWPALKDELTAFENLDAWTALNDRRLARKAIEAALDAVALAGRQRLPVRVLSQGQRRRIGLARLALSQCPLWILDEPLTALDDDAIEVLGSLLARHLAADGLCIAASHAPLPLDAARAMILALGTPT